MIVLTWSCSKELVVVKNHDHVHFQLQRTNKTLQLPNVLNFLMCYHHFSIMIILPTRYWSEVTQNISFSLIRG